MMETVNRIRESIEKYCDVNDIGINNKVIHIYITTDNERAIIHGWNNHCELHPRQYIVGLIWNSVSKIVDKNKYGLEIHTKYHHLDIQH